MYVAIAVLAMFLAKHWAISAICSIISASRDSGRISGALHGPLQFVSRHSFSYARYVAGILLLWLLVTVRVRYVASGVKARAAERAEERDRIAWTLHDTLLQSLQGLLLTFHAAAQKVSSDKESRIILDRALASAEALMIKGRNQLTSLRAARSDDSYLEGHIRRVGTELEQNNRATIELHRRGAATTLRPHVVYDLCDIVEEALMNCFRHSSASIISVTLHYGRRRFVIHCKDNGHVFNVKRQKEPRALGALGLQEMKERIEKMGGHLLIDNSPSGTEICITLPSHLAYLKHPWFSRRK